LENPDSMLTTSHPAKLFAIIHALKTFAFVMGSSCKVALRSSPPTSCSLRATRASLRNGSRFEILARHQHLHLAIKKHETCVRNIERHRRADIAVSAITVAELEHSAAKSQYPVRSRESLVKFLSYFELLDFDQAAAEHYGVIQACLEPIGPMDTLIAAVARARSLTVVTNNVDEFSRVPGIEVEDWI